MKTNSVNPEKQSNLEVNQIAILEENISEEPPAETPDHFESILRIYQEENEQLRTQLLEFQQANQTLRKENIQLKIKLSELENSKEIEVTRLTPSIPTYKHRSDAIERDLNAKPTRKDSRRSVPETNNHQKKLSPQHSMIISPSQKEVSPQKRPSRKSKKNRSSTSKYVPSYTRSLKS